MEKELIVKWLSGYGNGCGDGSGNGDGYGSGDGSGNGDGNGDGYGSGYGSGYGNGYGNGFGNGFGNGSGNGSGNGYGNGSGNGNGCGDGSGYGSGYGEKILKYKGEVVFYVDSLPTIIKSIKGNYAKGFTINEDYSISPCYISKNPELGLFAHGETLREAEEALISKISRTLSTEEIINLFCKNFEKGKAYKGEIFFDWHNHLTGSCEFGRKSFVENKGLSLEDDYTVEQFISLVENEYGSSIIKELKKAWEKK